MTHQQDVPQPSVCHNHTYVLFKRTLSDKCVEGFPGSDYLNSPYTINILNHI
jgi:hypothetical protein